MIRIFLQDWFVTLGLSNNQALIAASVVVFLLLLLIAYLVHFIVNRVVIHHLDKLAQKTRTTWDNILFEEKVFKRLSHLIPAIIIYYGAIYTFEDFSETVSLIKSGVYLYMVVMAVLVLDAAINGLHEIYKTLSVSKNRSIKGYVQVVKIFIYILGTGIVFSILLQKNLTSFFAGLGAMAAVIMLIFKDSILGLVAGVQLSANDMVRLGDWIEMPSRNADGTVLDISLNTVKVQNWDRTISTIPTYALVSESFTNWRGMEESGGRRIKRSVNIDMKSIRFLSDEDIERLKKIRLLTDYLENKTEEIKAHNKQQGVDDSLQVNGRNLTNIGTFRQYVSAYLHNLSQIHSGMTFLVRHLQPTDKGLPLEIYVFSKEQRWAYYEALQADIFDHLLAVIPEFDLNIFQSPSGADISDFLKQNVGS
jgi:miniconductance mechanosensitive channel